MYAVILTCARCAEPLILDWHSPSLIFGEGAGGEVSQAFGLSMQFSRGDTKNAKTTLRFSAFFASLRFDLTLRLR